MVSTAATVATPVGMAALQAMAAMLLQPGALTHRASGVMAAVQDVTAAVVREGKALQATMAATVESVDCSVEPVAMAAPVEMPSSSGRSAATAAMAVRRDHVRAQVSVAMVVRAEQGARVIPPRRVVLAAMVVLAESAWASVGRAAPGAMVAWDSMPRRLSRALVPRGRTAPRVAQVAMVASVELRWGRQVAGVPAALEVPVDSVAQARQVPTERSMVKARSPEVTAATGRMAVPAVLVATVA